MKLPPFHSGFPAGILHRFAEVPDPREEIIAIFNRVNSTTGAHGDSDVAGRTAEIGHVPQAAAQGADSERMINRDREPRGAAGPSLLMSRRWPVIVPG